MPAISKQHPTKTVKKQSGSILNRAKSVADVRPEYVRMVCYGGNRTGKTTFACTWPKPLLLVSFEPAEAGGTESVADVDGVEVLQIKTREDMLQFCEELKDGSPYATHVLDTGTSFQDAVLCGILGLDRMPEQMSFGGVKKEQYFARADQVKEAMRKFMTLPAHTLVLNQEKDHRPKDKDITDMTPKLVAGLKLDSFIASDLGGSTVGWLHDVCPYICRLYLAEREEQVEVEKKGVKLKQINLIKERRLLMQLQPNFAAGFRAPTSIKVPDYLANPTFDKFQKLIRG